MEVRWKGECELLLCWDYFTTHTNRHTLDTNTQWPVCLRQPFSSIASPLTALGNLVDGARLFAIRPTYCTDLGGCGWDKVEQRASPEHVCLFRHCTEDLSKKHVLLLIRQDVLSSATHAFLSINPSQSHTHTDKFSFS